MKKTCYISCPINTYSGYGSRSRDVVRALIESDIFDVKVIPQRWGNTPENFIEDHMGEWGFIKNYYQRNEDTPTPDVFIMISIPNEMVRYGKFNILITAGIESTIASADFIKGCNKADLVLVSSEFSKNTLSNTSYTVQNKQNGQVSQLKLTTPIEVLFEGIDILKYNPDNFDGDLTKTIIPEKFGFLFVGTWLPGDFPHDRKGIGLLIYEFLDTFKNRPNPPCLMLKTSHSGPSTLDRYEITKKINKIKEKYTKDNPHTRNLPNIYLVHGDLSDKDMCNLYNNPKVKAMVSLTRGEGFGRPLLEFSMVNKPIIASNWSGQLDFLNPEFVNLIPGVLVNIHPSASNKMLLQEAQWFEPNTQTFKKLLLDVYKNYKKHQEKAKRQGYYARNNFSYEKMKEKINTIFGNLNLVETIDFKE